MKPISEYNFREIVGKFVFFENKKINPEYGKCVGYCYIDNEAGISINVFGKIMANDDIEIISDAMYTIRYSPDFIIDVSSETNEDEIFKELKNKFNAVYNSGNITEIRNITDLDPYRDNKFPDDLLLTTATLYENKIYFESLWIRTEHIDKDGNIFGKTIENGKKILKDSIVTIIDNKILGGKEVFDLPDIIAIDQKVANYLVEKIQEENNV